MMPTLTYGSFRTLLIILFISAFCAVIHITYARPIVLPLSDLEGTVTYSLFFLPSDMFISAHTTS